MNTSVGQGKKLIIQEIRAGTAQSPEVRSQGPGI